MFGGETNGLYFVFWRRDGVEAARSSNAPPQVPMPGLRSPGAMLNGTRLRGEWREGFHYTPPGDCLLVGRSIEPELEGLREFALWLAALGAGVLALGLAGGWWMAARAIRPIDDISAAATKIATGDLSQRMPAGEADTELGRLAGVLNSTFARLEAAFTQQAQFTSDAAHELRTPVSVILTQVQGALNRERTGPEYRETLEACQRAAQRMRRLIGSLLELSRFDAGQERLKRVPLDLAVTAREAIELLQPLAEERRVRFVTELAPGLCEGDPERLGQVLANLVTNAVNYNQPEGEVRVRTQVQAGSVVLTVSNTGPGIAAEELPRLFERFYRSDKARTRSAGSAGLGLAICKAIVSAHGGTIEAASGVLEGTRFTVRLPAC